MVAGLLFVVATLLPILLLVIVYTKQNKRKTSGTTVFKYILFGNVYIVIFELLNAYIMSKGHVTTGLILLRTQWAVGALCFYFIYLYNIIKLKNLDSLKLTEILSKRLETKIFTIFTGLFLLTLLILPITNYQVGVINYLHKPHAYLTMGYAALAFGLIIINLIKTKNIERNLKVVIYAELATGTLFTGLETFLNDIALSPIFISGLILLIYMFQENPDIYTAKELDSVQTQINNNINDSNFITDQYRKELIYKINLINNTLNLYKNGQMTREEILEKIDQIKFEIKSLNAETCNTVSIILNEEADDVEVEIILDKYLKRFYRLTNKLITNKNIVYRMDILESTPAKVLINTDDLFFSMLSIFKNSLNNTEIGEIILTVGGEVINGKHYLTIKCNDTGRGYSKEELTKLQDALKNNSDTTEFDKNIIFANKRRKIYGGELTVDSFEGAGTIVNMKIEYGSIDESRMPRKIIDKIVELEDDSIFDCERKRALVISSVKRDSQSLLGLYNIVEDKVETGKDLLDKLKQNNEYEWIFINLEHSEAKDITKALKALNKSFGYNIPYVIGVVPYKTKKYRQIINSSSVINDYIIEPLEIIDLNTVLRKVRRK